MKNPLDETAGISSELKKEYEEIKYTVEDFGPALKTLGRMRPAVREFNSIFWDLQQIKSELITPELRKELGYLISRINSNTYVLETNNEYMYENLTSLDLEKMNPLLPGHVLLFPKSIIGTVVEAKLFYENVAEYFVLNPIPVDTGQVMEESANQILGLVYILSYEIHKAFRTKKNKTKE